MIHYRLTENKKFEIAKNLIDILDNDIEPSNDTVNFISHWLRSVRSEKTKAFNDVWEIVLKNFYPKKRPILIRGLERKSKAEYIASFTNSKSCAKKFSNYKGYWIICDTKDCLLEFQTNNKGNYRHSFYPLTEVLQKAKKNGGWGFSDFILEHYCGEDEYIMKINFSFMHILKFIKQYE